MTIPLSRSPSRIPGWLGCLLTVPVVGPEAIAAWIVFPSAWEMDTAGMPIGGAVITAVRTGGEEVALWATTNARPPSDSATSARARNVHAVVPPSTIAIHEVSGRSAG